MRARLLVVIPLVVVLVLGLLGAAGYTGYRLLLSRQQDHFADGHAGFVRGDCRAAMPLLKAADITRFDDAVAEQAAREWKACADLQSVRDRTATTTAESALKLYTAFLIGKHDGPMLTAARRDARVLFGSFVKRPPPSSYFCLHRDHLVDVGVLVVSPRDAMAAPFLAGCGQFYAKERAWEEARLLFTQLQRELPTTREAVTTVDDLARATAALLPADWRPLGPVTGHQPEVSLHGKVRLVLTNSSPWNLEFSTTGKQELFTGIPECKECKVFPTAAAANCKQEGHPVVLTLPAGRYSARLLYFDPKYPDSPTYKYTASWSLQAGEEYNYCFWVFAN